MNPIKHAWRRLNSPMSIPEQLKTTVEELIDNLIIVHNNNVYL